MNKNTFVKGMSLGLVLGSVVGMAVMPKQKKSSVGKALKNAGELLDGFIGGFGL